MLGYSFITLSPEEVQNRRQLLDIYTAIAQFSPIVPILCIHVYCGARWAFRTILADSNAQGKQAWLSRRLSYLGRIQFWIDEGLGVGFTRGECACVALWTLWLLFLSVHRTGHDLLHLTRRLGAVGVAQLPLQYLLGRSSTQKALHLLTGLSYKRQLAAHRLLGWIVFVFVTLHASLYTHFFVQSGLFTARMRDKDVMTGMGTCTALLLLMATSLGCVSHRSYRVFYTTHVFVGVLIVGLLLVHTRHARTYVWEMVAARILDEALRRRSTRIFCATIEVIPGTNLVRVAMALPSRAECRLFGLGQHVQVGRPPLGRASAAWTDAMAARYRRNPFTVASLPASDGELLLIARVRSARGCTGTGTGRLEAVARWTAGLGAPRPMVPLTVPLTVEGPYGPALAVADLCGCAHVLVVAGGVGATFGLPVFRSVMASKRSGVSFVWAVQHRAEASWAFDQERGAEHVELYVTGPREGRDEGAASLLGELEMAERGLGLPEPQLQPLPRGGVVKRGRPCLSSLVDQVFTASDGRVAVVVCGPNGMVQELRESVRSWMCRGRHVLWHAESFAQ